MQQIKICTAFDITQTGVNRPYKQQPLPTKINGMDINTVEEWNRFRRQQSNWETVLQVLLFRTQPMQLSDVVYDKKWCFTFANETKDVFLLDGDPLGALKRDFEGTPIIVGLNETSKVLPYVHTSGKDQNIWITEI
jgi:uncharacterized protein YukJ